MSNYKVLLVEDDKVDQMAFERYVKKEKINYDYTIAGSVEEAKKIITANLFDIIIVDYMLGDGTGLEILELKLETPIIMLTGTGSEEVVIKAIKAGALDYIIKDPDRNYLKTLPLTVDHAINLKSAEQKSTKNESLFRSLFEMSNDAIFIVNFEGKIVDANNRACELLKYNYDELVSMPINSLHSSGALDKASQLLDTMKTKGYYRFDAKFRTSDEAIIDVDISARVINQEEGVFQEIVRDMTDQKRKEKTLIENERTLKRILENVQTGIVIIDASDHRIVDVNRNAAQLIDLPKEKIIGNICHNFICSAKFGECEVTDLGEYVDNSEKTFLNSKGEEITIIKTVTTIMLGGRRHLVESIVDIRKIKESEEEIRRA